MIRNAPYMSNSSSTRQDEVDLDIFMNTDVKEALGIPSNVTWGGQSNAVFNYLNEDFMKPVTEGSKL